MIEWVPKCKMWVMGNRSLPYMCQDTNVAIINYHANLKATLRVAKSCDSLEYMRIGALTSYWDVLSHCLYQSLRKNWGFVSKKNKKTNKNYLLMFFFMQEKYQTT